MAKSLSSAGESALRRRMDGEFLQIMAINGAKAAEEWYRDECRKHGLKPDSRVLRKQPVRKLPDSVRAAFKTYYAHCASQKEIPWDKTVDFGAVCSAALQSGKIKSVQACAGMFFLNWFDGTVTTHDGTNYWKCKVHSRAKNNSGSASVDGPRTLAECAELLRKWTASLSRWSMRKALVFDDHVYLNEAQSRGKLILFTATNKYSISFAPADGRSPMGYLGAIVQQRTERPGEDWNRGHDLHDGKFTKETFDEIVLDILANEMIPAARPCRCLYDKAAARKWLETHSLPGND